MAEVKRGKGRPPLTDETPLTPLQEIFCETYLETFNAKESYMKTHPGCAETTARNEGSKMLKKPNIQKYIRGAMDDKKAEIVARQEEVLQFYTDTMRAEELNYNKPIYMKDRLAAADALAKYYQLFVEKKEINANINNIVVDIVDDEI
jgi:phage terminase small subunit